jgi:phytoene dehydrogenase-like protein
MLVLNDWQLEREYRPEETQFMLAVAPAWDSRGPDGSRAATIHSFTDVDEWFTYHQDETELEQRDQQLLEATWQAVHAAVPELGDGIEVIDTATPRSFYDSTRRKLGMVGGLMAADYPLLHDSIDSAVDNLFLVSDTITPGGLAPVCQAAYRLADTLTK